VVKSGTKVLILIHPPFSIPIIGIKASPSRNNLTNGRRSWNIIRLKHQGLMDRNMPFGIKGWKPFYKDTDLMFGN
jgi:hypothetical protein